MPGGMQEKKSKKIKTGLAFPGNHAIFSMFVQQGKQGFYLMRDQRPRRNRGNREPPKENFLFLGYNACLRETGLLNRQGVTAPTANRLFLYSRRKHHEQG